MVLLASQRRVVEELHRLAGTCEDASLSSVMNEVKKREVFLPSAAGLRVRCRTY